MLHGASNLAEIDRVDVPWTKELERSERRRATDRAAATGHPGARAESGVDDRLVEDAEGAARRLSAGAKRQVVRCASAGSRSLRAGDAISAHRQPHRRALARPSQCAEPVRGIARRSARRPRRIPPGGSARSVETARILVQRRPQAALTLRGSRSPDLAPHSATARRRPFRVAISRQKRASSSIGAAQGRTMSLRPANNARGEDGFQCARERHPAQRVERT